MLSLMPASRFQSYSVLNVAITDLKRIAPPEGNHYLIFWYQKIPLGHLWYNKILDAGNFRKQAVNSAANALNYYSSAGAKSPEEWLGLIERDEISSLLNNTEVGSRNSSSEKISVVICTRNRPEALKVCIDQLYQSDDKNFELIIIDNAPDNDGSRKITELYPEIKYVREERKGLDIARNTGISTASCNIVAFTDDDVSVDPTWIAELKRSFENPQTMAVTGMVIPRELRSRAQYIFERDWSFNKGYLPQIFDTRYFQSKVNEGVPVWDIGAGANMAFRKDIFQIAGNFDERLDAGASGCSGDSEMWYRVLAEGWDCYYNPRLLVYHQHRSTMKELSHQLFSYMRGHVTALLVQHENYQHDGNLKRLNQTLPLWYAKRVKTFLKTLDPSHIQTIHQEIRGYVSGRRFYRRTRLVDNRNRSYQRDCIRTPQEPPYIPPLENTENRPIWSVMIPTYNCYPYIKECLESVLMQNIPPDEMQIEIIDDCSTDGDVERLVNETGNGRVKFFRQPKNAGSLRNFETCINRAKGKYVHILHGDDKLKRGFYEEIGSLYEQFPDVGAVFSDFEYIDSSSNKLYTEAPLMENSGVIENWLERISISQRVQPPSMVIRRSVYEHLGSYCSVHYGEDWEMYVRIAANYKVAHCVKQLAQYRVHGTNITSYSLQSGQNVKDIKKVISIIQKYVPEDKRDFIRRASYKHFSIYFASIADKIYHEYGNPPAAMKQAYLALRMHCNQVTLKFMLKILFKTAIRYKMPQPGFKEKGAAKLSSASMQ